MTEEKVRLAKLVFIIIKEISIYIGIFLITFIITTAICISSIKAKETEKNEKSQLKEVIQQDVDQSKAESQDRENALLEHQSTMSRMITGKETAKGDRAVELEKIARKKARERKKRAKEKRRRLMNKHKKHYSSSNLELMAHLIYGEAGDQNDSCQQAVGMVVINRANDSSFIQDTVKGVIFSPGQYACTEDGNFEKTPSKQAYKNAKAVLTGNTIIDVPEDVVYQSQFAQGSKIWKKIGTEIFCCK